MSSPGDSGYFVDVTTAKNGAFAYQTLLDVLSGGITGAPGQQNQGHVTYALRKPGDFIFGFDARLSNGSDERLVLTDSVGGTNDNTGAWRIDHIVFDH